MVSMVTIMPAFCSVVHASASSSVCFIFSLHLTAHDEFVFLHYFFVPFLLFQQQVSLDFSVTTTKLYLHTFFFNLGKYFTLVCMAACHILWLI